MSWRSVGILVALTMPVVLPMSTDDAPLPRAQIEAATQELQEDEDVPGVCVLARALNQQARPQDARALIDEHRAAALSHRNDCVLTYFNAQARTSLATVVSTLEDDDALDSFQDQLSTVCTAAPDTNTRSDAIAACDVAVSGPPPPQTWSERASSAMEKFTDRWTVPLESLALAVLGLLAAIYVLARLLTRKVPAQALVETAASSDRRTARGAEALAVTALATAAFVVLIAGVPGEGSALLDLTVLYLALVIIVAGLALWAAWAFAHYLASRFTISVTAHGSDGKESQPAAAHIIGLLNELGARSPQGAEYPRGTDVSALDTAVLSALPTGALAKILVGIVSVFLPRAPWEVSVDVESEDRETVQITHNGRSVFAGVVDRDQLGLRRPAVESGATTPDAATTVTPDLHRVTAAMVLAQLQRVHRLPGLGGATDGTSIGLQAVATTDLAREYDTAVPLLARAVAIDSGNLGATLALLHHRFRDATTLAELRVYDRELTKLCGRLGGLRDDDPTGFTLLCSRARLNQVVARINAAYAADRAEPDPRLLRSARSLAAKLVKETETYAARTTPSDSATVLASIGRNGRILQVVGENTRALEPRTPLEHHQAACHYATAPTQQPMKAVHHLQIAATDPLLASWRARDPQLSRFRRTVAYRRAFPPEKGTFFALPGIAGMGAALTRLGITNERELLAHRPDDLGPLLGLPPAATERLIALARLVSRVPVELHSWRFSIATWVVEQAQKPTTRSELGESAGKEFAEMLDAEEIDALLAWIKGSGLPWRSPVADYLRAVR